MAKEIDWEGRIGRRLRLRDLHIFFYGRTVRQHGQGRSKAWSYAAGCL